MFLGRLVGGPFFPEKADGCCTIVSEVEIQGELVGRHPRDTNDRPSPGSAVYQLPAAEVRSMLGLNGDMALGHLSGREDLGVSLLSNSKEVLPRNVGIFGTVGSGKSNSVQVLIEEAAAHGWAVILLDLEAEYVDMDQPASRPGLAEQLARCGRQPQGLPDFHVYHPVSCDSDKKSSVPFTLRLADFESSITSELLQATLAERNALLDCIDYFEQKFYTAMRTNDSQKQTELLDSSPQAKLPYTLQHLRSRAAEALAARHRVARLHRPDEQAATADPFGGVRSAEHEEPRSGGDAAAGAGQRH